MKKRIVACILVLVMAFHSENVIYAVESMENSSSVEGVEIEESVSENQPDEEVGEFSESIIEEEIEIANAEELCQIMENLAGNYILTNSIDLSGMEWNPIGTKEDPFTGTFNGNGHAIRGMWIESKATEEAQALGLFGVLKNAKVENVAVEDVNIVSNTENEIYAGAIAGIAENSVIENCYVSGNIEVMGNAVSTLGGVVGAVCGDEEENDFEYNLSKCFARVNLKVDSEAEGKRGSIVGYVDDAARVGGAYSIEGNTTLFGISVEGDSCQFLSKEEAVREEAYVGFDFEDVWVMTEQGGKTATASEG